MGDEDDVAANAGDILPPTGVGVILHSRSPEAETGKEAISLTLILSEISLSQPYFPKRQARPPYSCFPNMSSMVLPEQFCISLRVGGLLSVFRTGFLF